MGGRRVVITGLGVVDEKARQRGSKEVSAVEEMTHPIPAILTETLDRGNFVSPQFPASVESLSFLNYRGFGERLLT